MTMYAYSKGAPTKGMMEALARMHDSPTRQLERRRGNLNAGAGQAYWNNYWTVPEQSVTAPSWYAQGHTVAGLAHRGLITLTHTRKGTPSRYILAEAGRRLVVDARRAAKAEARKLILAQREAAHAG